MTRRLTLLTRGKCLKSLKMSKIVNRKCIFPKCSYMGTTGLYKFPLKDKNRLELWLKVCQISCVKPHQMICKNHFHSDDFLLQIHLINCSLFITHSFFSLKNLVPNSYKSSNIYKSRLDNFITTWPWSERKYVMN